MYTKTCYDCRETYTATGPAGKYCRTCNERRVELRKEANRLRAYKSRREKGCRLGRGALPGTGHPNYKHGFYVAQTQAKQYKVIAGNQCERCGKDLTDANRYGWAMHHKDHNHSNHDLRNLELLCKRCHQMEHGCQDKLKVQRPSREGVPPSGGKRTAS